MRKTILIPTDFTIESLRMVKAFLSQAEAGQKYDLILLHGMHLSDSITDFFFYSKTKLLHALTNRAFEEACAILKNKFVSNVLTIRKDLFTGSTQSAFELYLEANSIDAAYIPAHYHLKLTDENSFDLIPYIKKSELATSSIEWELIEAPQGEENVADIFRP